MPDAIEYMPYDKRIARLEEIAQRIVELLRKHTRPVELTVFLQEVAQTLRLAMSQVKYGLTYAKSSGRVTVDSAAMVALVP
ncbi:hypothetical protein [Microbacterium enclense]|uniref:Uncharacterized protein n=1 Tax=Microbacterium enclense TaxID=993073 RepID=A0A1G6ID57_9MICO|nr:hypothetical protein [Microbacterium enclense]KSU55005.1 hypothetical protein AS029_06030 [Microbacterium enclense]SDC03925.1 hypothetical protein SAMN05216418_1462 [Microbacterium enclense]